MGKGRKKSCDEEENHGKKRKTMEKYITRRKGRKSLGREENMEKRGKSGKKRKIMKKLKRKKCIYE